MVHAIIEPCATDMKWVKTRPIKAIHPREDEPDGATVKQFFIHPKRCLDCGVCVDVCESHAFLSPDTLPPERAHFVEINPAYYRKG